MTLIDVSPLYRNELDAAALMREHPPRISFPAKQQIFERASAGPAHRGRLSVTRWAELSLPDSIERWHPTELILRGDRFSYPTPEPGWTEWHLNFADPALFFGYGGPMFAQDELQVAEHPILGALREALEAESRELVSTVDGSESRPILIRGAERRVAIDSERVYGRQLMRTSPELLDQLVAKLDPPTTSNLIAIAAPSYGRGPYRSLEIESVLRTAFTAFRAARHESASTRVSIHTGFWGCGAFGGNRVLMTLLQLLSARMAGVDRLVFHAIGGDGQERYAIAKARHDALTDGPIAAGKLIGKITAFGDAWGESDGN